MQQMWQHRNLGIWWWQHSSQFFIIISKQFFNFRVGSEQEWNMTTKLLKFYKRKDCWDNVTTTSFLVRISKHFSQIQLYSVGLIKSISKINEYMDIKFNNLHKYIYGIMFTDEIRESRKFFQGSKVWKKI